MLLSVLLFAAALTQTAFFWGTQGASAVTGWRLLLRGSSGLSGGYVEWLANPLLLASWIAALRGWRALWLAASLAAGLLMLVFLFRQQIHRLGPGYWLWLASAAVSVAARMRAPAR